MKRGLCIILTLMLSVSTQGYCVIAKEDTGSILKKYYIEECQSKDIDLKKERFETENKYAELQEDLEQIEENGKIKNYGGCYIEDNNIVVMSDDVKQLKKKAFQLISLSNVNIRIKN